MNSRPAKQRSLLCFRRKTLTYTALACHWRFGHVLGSGLELAEENPWLRLLYIDAKVSRGGSGAGVEIANWIHGG